MSRNIQNINISTLNGLTNPYPTSGYITVNNTFKIASTPYQTGNADDNAPAMVYLKDNISNGTGVFYSLNSNTYTGLPELYFNGNIIITGANLLNEFEIIALEYPIDFSNILITGGYVNFENGSYPNSNIGPLGTGIRYSSNGVMQFRNWNTDWIDIPNADLYNEFRELLDVDVFSNPLQNNQYIIYNATSNLFVNANLAISNDTNPTLGGNLVSNGYNFIVSTGNVAFIDENNNGILQLTSATTYDNIGNYVKIINADSGSAPIITVDGLVNADISLNINAKGSGDVTVNATAGDIILNSDSVNISGYMVNSIYRTSTKVGGYLPATTWNIPISSDTILFNFYSNSTIGTYWANVGAGFDGQKLNLIFNNSNTSGGIDVLVDFGANGLICGTGTATGIHLNSSGQSSMLVYLDDDINKWQILNTGGGVF